MALSKNFGAYSDVQLVLDRCLDKGELRLTFAKPHKAKTFQMRAYTFRRLYRERQERHSPASPDSDLTPYDCITLRLRDNVLIITTHEAVLQDEVEITDGDGNPIEIEESPAKPAARASSETESLEEQAKALRLGLLNDE